MCICRYISACVPVHVGYVCVPVDVVDVSSVSVPVHVHLPIHLGLCAGACGLRLRAGGHGARLWFRHRVVAWSGVSKHLLSGSALGLGWLVSDQGLLIMPFTTPPFLHGAFL
jgi:hypothetical protein